MSDVNSDKENNKVNNDISNLFDFFESIKRIANAASESVNGLVQIIANIKFPEFKLPKFNFPEIDYKRIRQITENNSKYGWTLTGEMGIEEYLDDDLLTLSKDKIDSYFYAYYNTKNDDVSFYREVKISLIKQVNPKWRELLEQSFKCHELEIYKIAIPTLILIIEGEISEIANSDLVGGQLLTHWKQEIDTESDKFNAIVLYSLYHFLKEVLFKTRDFKKDRLEVINRNWVLHGRDDPAYWKVEDFFRLINVLNSIQFVKEIIKN